jgi:hypothetical protein
MATQQAEEERWISVTDPAYVEGGGGASKSFLLCRATGRMLAKGNRGAGPRCHSLSLTLYNNWWDSPYKKEWGEASWQRGTRAGKRGGYARIGARCTGYPSWPGLVLSQ